MQYATRISTKISYNLSHICSIHVGHREAFAYALDFDTGRSRRGNSEGRGEKRTGGARATGVVVLAPTWTTRCQSLGPVIGRNNEERFPPFPSRFYPVRTGKSATGGLTRRDIPVHPVIGYYRQPLSLFCRCFEAVPQLPDEWRVFWDKLIDLCAEEDRVEFKSL